MTLKKKQSALEGQTRYVNAQGSVKCGEVHTGEQIFFNRLLKLTNQK